MPIELATCLLIAIVADLEILLFELWPLGTNRRLETEITLGMPVSSMNKAFGG